MSLDIKKFKKILQKFDIAILEYYAIDKKCSLIKCFINSICEFLLIYIPSKIRFQIDAQNLYDIVEIDERSDNDDYSSSSKVPNMQNIDEEKSVSKYEEMTKKYKTNISLDGSDEPIPRKLKRQMTRLKIPFSNLEYDIAINNGKYIGVSFGDSISIFHIKNYNGHNKQIMYLINVNSLIKNIDDVEDNVNNIKTQFYEIIRNITVSNFNSLTDNTGNIFNKNYDVFISGLVSKKDDYKKSIQEYNILYKKIKDKENTIIGEYQKITSDTSRGSDDMIKIKAMSSKCQKELNDVFYSKNDAIKKGILLVNKYQRSLLTLEEVSFDNSIMIDRVNKNFEQLKEL
jgi:hypothetical protein